MSERAEASSKGVPHPSRLEPALSQWLRTRRLGPLERVFPSKDEERVKRADLS